MSFSESWNLADFTHKWNGKDVKVTLAKIKMLLAVEK
jgi:hypothetical protein